MERVPMTSGEVHAQSTARATLAHQYNCHGWQYARCAGTCLQHYRRDLQRVRMQFVCAKLCISHVDRTCSLTRSPSMGKICTNTQHSTIKKGLHQSTADMY